MTCCPKPGRPTAASELLPPGTLGLSPSSPARFPGHPECVRGHVPPPLVPVPGLDLRLEARAPGQASSAPRKGRPTFRPSHPGHGGRGGSEALKPGLLTGCHPTLCL